MRVFNSYLQLCSLSYWGPSGGPAGPRMGAKHSNYTDIDMGPNAIENGNAKANTAAGATGTSAA